MPKTTISEFQFLQQFDTEDKAVAPTIKISFEVNAKSSLKFIWKFRQLI